MVINRQRRIPVAIGPLESFLDRARRALHLDGRETTVCLVSNREMARMNSAFRGKRGPTDVLSFPAGRAGPVGSSAYLGDIAIAPETARRNARRYSRALAQELRVLVLHGMLHLAGYDHETDRGRMERLERRLRRKLGLS